MKQLIQALCSLSAALPFMVAALLIPAARAQEIMELNGEKIVTISRVPSDPTRPELTSVTVAPGRGMEVLQITANFPGKGNVDVLASPDLAGIKNMLDVQDTPNGDLGYRLGAAFLVPYPNRIRGKLSADSQTLTTEWRGHTITLPANNIGKLPTAERHAMHGLILKAKTDDVKQQSGTGGGTVTGVIHAGDFGGHWLSKTDLVITISLTAENVDATVEARNVGSEDEPMAIAWHPYFNLPSGDRSQVRVTIPAESTAEVDGYDNVFPTGKILSVKGTKFDFRSPAGVPLGTNFFDDNWNHIDWQKKAATVRIVDPAAHYGVDIVGMSPEIKAIQMYAPPTAKFVAVEHQYNFGDPFGKEWGSTDTGMVTLSAFMSSCLRRRLMCPGFQARSPFGRRGACVGARNPN
ncbi:MAG: aldose 1-epimerase [Terracidiphilus sp.]